MQRFERTAPSLQIDFDQSVFQAYVNVINSFQGLETTASAIEGISQMQTQISMERFQANLGILDGMIHGWKDEDFKKEVTTKITYEDVPFEYWRALNSLLIRNGFFKRKNLAGEL